MIARVWRGVVHAEHAEEYVRYIRDTGGGEYKRTPGNQGAWTMTRIDGGRAEIIALSFWESRTAIEAFTGPDIEHQVCIGGRTLPPGPSTTSHYDSRTSNRCAPFSSSSPALTTTMDRRCCLWRHQGTVRSMQTWTPLFRGAMSGVF